MKSLLKKIWKWIFEYPFPKDFLYILLCTFVGGLSLLLSRFMVPLLTQERMYDKGTADFMGGLPGLGALVGIFGLAWLSNIYGRKPVIMAGLAGAGIATILLAYARPVWLVSFLAVSVGVGNGVVTATTRACIQDLMQAYISSHSITSQEEKDAVITKGFTLYYWVFNFGATVSFVPVLCVRMFSRSTSALVAFDGSANMICVVIVALGVTAYTLQSQQNKKKMIIDPFVCLIKDRHLLVFVALSTCVYAIYWQSSGTLSLSMEARRFEPSLISVVMIINAGLVLFLGHKAFLKNWPIKQALATGIFLIGGGLALNVLVVVPGIPVLRWPFAWPGILEGVDCSFVLVYVVAQFPWTFGEMFYSVSEGRHISRLSGLRKEKDGEDHTSSYQVMAGRFPLYTGLFLGSAAGGSTFKHLGEDILWPGCLVIALLITGGFLMMERLAAISWRGLLADIRPSKLDVYSIRLGLMLWLLVSASSPLPRAAIVHVPVIPPKGVYQVHCNGSATIELVASDRTSVCFVGQGDLSLKKDLLNVHRIRIFRSMLAWVSYSSGDGVVPRAYSQMYLQQGDNLVSTSMSIPQMPINGIHLGSLAAPYPAFAQSPWVHEVYGWPCYSRDDFAAFVTPTLDKYCFANAGHIHLSSELETVAFSSGANQVQYIYLNKDVNYTEFDLSLGQPVSVSTLFPGVTSFSVTDVHIN